RTLHFIKNPDKQHRIALETMEIYAPLARIIGIDRFREELENLSFYYLLPEEYAGITAALERVAETAVSDVVALSQRLKKAISEAGIEAEIFSREKRAYSVYRKMQRKKVHFEELADIYAFRVIVPNEEDCYRALGVIHRTFRMIPGEFDDYISTPKPNNYRSLHTAVLLSEEQASQAQKAEIQIRTKEMHDAAERGIAAHWRYKAKGGSSVEMGGAENYNAYELLRETVKDLEKGATASELLQQAKIEFYSDQIFTFTPRGRVITLPVGASPLDFAYALHTDIGNDYTGAKVNGRQVPNRTTLKNGDVVEIFRADNAPIPADWQSFVVTGSAKLGLRRRMKAAQAEEQFDFGERILRNVFSAYEVPYSREALRKAARRMGFDTGRALIESVGRLEVRDIAVLDEVYPNLRAALRGPKRPVDSGVTYNRRSLVIDGIDPGATVTLAACCRPLPGERVVGVQGTEDEVTIHRIDCRVLADQAEATWIPVGLKEDPEVTFVSELVLTVTNRAGAIGHIGTLLAKYDANIFDVRVENREAQFSDLRLQITVSDSRHLGHVMTALRGSHFVVAIERANNTEDGR
ncbi:MAG: TGS domain-containing protein, partial [Pseudomonadota bacterium]